MEVVCSRRSWLCDCPAGAARTTIADVIWNASTGNAKDTNFKVQGES